MPRPDGRAADRGGPGRQPPGQSLCARPHAAGQPHVGIGRDISFRQDELNDNPPRDYDPLYGWPRAAGYDRSLERMSYTPVESWQTLSKALQDAGTSGAEAAAVMGDNMLRVAGQVWHRPRS